MTDSPHEDTEQTKQDRYNEVIRASHEGGYSILHEMELDLIEAWVAHDGEAQGSDRQRAIRGRIRGIAQCIALIRSPYTRRELGPRSARWMRVIKDQEEEGHARARLRMKEGRE